MRDRIIVHRAQDGSYWAEVREVPGYVASGTTVAEVMHRICRAMEACDTAERITGPVAR